MTDTSQESAFQGIFHVGILLSVFHSMLIDGIGYHTTLVCAYGLCRLYHISLRFAIALSNFHCSIRNRQVTIGSRSAALRLCTRLSLSIKQCCVVCARLRDKFIKSFSVHINHRHAVAIGVSCITRMLSREDGSLSMRIFAGGILQAFPKLNGFTVSRHRYSSFSSYPISRPVSSRRATVYTSRLSFS